MSIYANMVGSQIVETNHVLDSVTNDAVPIDDARRNFNKAVLMDVGCSVWMPSLKGQPKSELTDFFNGITMANKRVGLVESECINKLRDELLN